MKLTYRQDGKDRAPRQRWGKKYDPVPPDRYTLRVLAVDTRTPKNGGADYLSATLEVETGTHAGRKMWDQFHINHAKPDARGVSRDRLDELAVACGLELPLDDTDRLIDRVCRAVVDVDDQEGTGYDPRNKVRRYLEPKEPLEQPYHEKPATAASRPTGQRRRTDLDDDIPF